MIGARTMKLIIAEKPSVAKNIADALKINTRKDGYFEGQDAIITWAFGHLFQLYDAKDYDPKMEQWKMENFPFIPENFQYKVKSNPRDRSKSDGGARKQAKIIYQLTKRPDVDMIVSACDYDREGQIIGDSIIQQLKTTKQVFRLLLNEWTPEEVLRGLQNIKPNSELKPLQDAGFSRQWADWVIGINLTSVATLKYQKGVGKALNIGRVLLPTLKIIYDRDQEIANFVPKDFFKLNATFKTEDNAEYEGTYILDEKEKFENREDLDQTLQLLKEKKGEIIDKQVEKKKEFPPFLFNLSGLQGYITNKYQGWTSDKVLKVAQSLYEKKYITYPRTSSTALEESLVGKTANVVKKLSEGLPYKEEVSFHVSKRVFNNAKVESHSAIIPTYMIPNRLTRDEEMVYTAIKNRLLMQFMPVAEYEETKLITKIDDVQIKGVFQSKGKVQLVEGWKKVENIKSKDAFLPNVTLGTTVSVEKAEVTSHVTKPPKPHTEKTLLRVMETCGRNIKEDDPDEVFGEILSGFSIGTAATRAETIKKLKDIGYIQQQQKSLLCTELGQKLVENFPIKDLFDLEFTGRLEKQLGDMEKGNVVRDDFLSLIFSFTKKSVETIKSDQEIIIHHIQKSAPAKREVLGKCPVCSHPVIEGKKGFGCSNWKAGCKFVIWKEDKFLATMKKRTSKTMVSSLLKDGVVHVQGLTSKKGTKFNAYLRYEKNPENDYFSWKMEFKR